MAAYAYTAINAQGFLSDGEIHAPTLDAAREQLRIRGLLAEKLEELPSVGEVGMKTAFKKIKPKSLQIFSRQFATMIEAGLSVVAALVILEEQTDDKYLRVVIHELRADVEGGLLLSQAMDRHPKVFVRLFVSMVEAGEAAGILDQVLDRMAFQIERETKLKSRVKGAMMYPIMVLIFATLVLTGMLLFLVPFFTKVFLTLGGKLPTLTQWVVNASNFIRSGLVPDHRLRGRRARSPSRSGGKHRARQAQLGPLQAAAADEDRRRRAQDHHGALLAHALDPRRRRRRHHPARSRSPSTDRRQLGRRGMR